MMTKARVLLFGGSGMIGSASLGLCLQHSDVASITSVGRRLLGLEHKKLREVVCTDFMDSASLADQIEECDIALYCLGAYAGSVSDDEFRRITVDYTVAFADALELESPDAAVCFLSGQGADPTGKSWMSFARHKGIAENRLLEGRFSRVHIFRPGYIYPSTPRREPNAGYRVMRGLYPVVRRLYSNIGIASDDLARAIVYAGLYGTAAHTAPILENRDIRALATTAAGLGDPNASNPVAKSSKLA